MKINSSVLSKSYAILVAEICSKIIYNSNWTDSRIISVEDWKPYKCRDISENNLVSYKISMFELPTVIVLYYFSDTLRSNKNHQHLALVIN